MAKSFALIVAWPETRCKQAGAWYDLFTNWLKISKNGYYKVGHAAIVLVNASTGECHYFDFGRYHAPKGYGRIRDAETDHDLLINTKITFDNLGTPNLEELLDELKTNKSCHGDGDLKIGYTPINFSYAYAEAKGMQAREFISYGPFILYGTNCSRFVRRIALKGTCSIIDWICLFFPPMITPTPMWNVLATRKNVSRKEIRTALQLTVKK